MKKRLHYLLICLWMGIYNLSVIAFSWCFKLIIDSLTQKEFSGFTNSIGFATIVVAVQAISNYLYIREKNGYVRDEMQDIKTKLIDRWFHLSVKKFYQEDISNYQSFLFNDLSVYEQNIVVGRIELLEKVLLLVFSCIAIIAINPLFLLLIIAAFLLSVFLPGFFGKFARKYNVLQSGAFAKANEKILEMLQGFMVIHTFCIEKKCAKECEKAVKSMEQAKNDLKTVIAVIQSCLMLMTTVLTLVIFIWGGRAVVSNMITVGELIALIQLLFNIASPLMGVMNILSNQKAAAPIKERLQGYLAQTEKVSGDREFGLCRQISVKNVSFSYPDQQQEILRDLNYTFQKGKKYAIVGENGSGKSTFLKVLAGTNQAGEYAGRIVYDDAQRDEISDKDFWMKVSYLPQSVFMFHKGVMENIKVQDADRVEMDEIRQLCDRIGAGRLLNERDEKNAATSAKDLSGGEKQKISFIRGIVKADTELLLADEPDAALDPESGSKMHHLLLQLHKTCIVVTHRINKNLQDYDQILVMKQGQIAESGTYQQLMERRGCFYAMNQEK